MNDGHIGALSRLLGTIGRGELPRDARVAAKSRLFHAFGVSFISNALASVDTAWAVVRNAPGECLAFGRTPRISADGAAFFNGVAGHGSLLEDCGPGGLREGSHPGTYIIPAALAAAESTGASGARFLAGLVVGYEAVSRIGAAAPLTIVKRRFRPVGVMGPLGAAAAVAIILGADDDQLAAALAIAANLSGGSTQGIFEGTMEPYYQAGFGARNGLMSAQLGMAGAVTSKQALEGEFGFYQTYGGQAGSESVLLAESEPLGICRVGTKRFAACLQNQQTLALIVDGVGESLTPDEIVRVVIERPENGTNGLNSPGVSRSAPFDNMLCAQMSARFTAAAALLGLPVDDPKFFQRRHGDAVIEALTRRVELVASPTDRVTVSIELASGKKILLDADKSDVLFPAPATIRSTFLQRASAVIGNNAEICAGMIDHLESLESLRTLTEAMLPYIAGEKTT
jgi:2-methylcitrate dehydratase PrpD